MFYISGDSTDIAFANSNDDFKRITKVPAFRAYKDGVGHGGTYTQPNGGDFGKVAVAMLEWQFKGDKEAGKMFLGANCGLCQDLEVARREERDQVNPMKHTRWWIVFSAGAVALIWSAGTGAQASVKPEPSPRRTAPLRNSATVSRFPRSVSRSPLSRSARRAGIRREEILPAWCSVNGSMAPVDHSATAKPINFQVAFPSTWNGRAVQLGGGGMNGMIPMLAGASSRARLRDLRQRLRPSDELRARPRREPQPGAVRRLGAERRSDPQPRLHADEEDARRRDGADRAHVRRASPSTTTTSARRRAAARL